MTNTGIAKGDLIFHCLFAKIVPQTPSPLVQNKEKIEDCKNAKWLLNIVIASALFRIYNCWYTANVVTRSVFNALLFGSDLVAAVLLCKNRGEDICRILYDPSCPLESLIYYKS